MKFSVATRGTVLCFLHKRWPDYNIPHQYQEHWFSTKKIPVFFLVNKPLHWILIISCMLCFTAVQNHAAIDEASEVHLHVPNLWHFQMLIRFWKVHRHHLLWTPTGSHLEMRAPQNTYAEHKDIHLLSVSICIWRPGRKLCVSFFHDVFWISPKTLSCNRSLYSMITEKKPTSIYKVCDKLKEYCHLIKILF